jgi:hypothetical protein
MKPLSILVVGAVCLNVAAAAGQPPVAQPAPDAGSATRAPGAPVPPPNYEYARDGRPDPFVSLVNKGTDAVGGRNVPLVRPDGVAGILVDEVVVRGVIESRGSWLAMVGTTTGRTYAVRPGDRLMDGSVRAITRESIVLLQDVNEPLAREKHREVRKYLRGDTK